jgi:hypothetical protein
MINLLTKYLSFFSEYDKIQQTLMKIKPVIKLNQWKTEPQFIYDGHYVP